MGHQVGTQEVNEGFRFNAWTVVILLLDSTNGVFVVT